MGPLSESESPSVSEACRSFLGSVRLGILADVPSGIRDRICIFGVDRCSIAAEIVSDISDERSPLPVTSIRDGRVPGWVDEGTTAVVVSWDGGCPEMMDVLDVLRGRGCRIVGISAGGRLSERADTIPIPASMDGVGAMGFALGALAAIVQGAGLFACADELSEAIGILEREIDTAAPSHAEAGDPLDGHVNAFYSTSDVHACSMAVKEMASRDSGRLAFCGELPEFDHNELVGWSDPNPHAPELQMAVMEGVSASPMVNTIVGSMAEVLRENGRPVLSLPIGGGTVAERDLRGILMGIAAIGIKEGRE